MYYANRRNREDALCWRNIPFWWRKTAEVFSRGSGKFIATAHRCRLDCDRMVFPPSTLRKRRARKPVGSFCRHLRKN